MACKPDRQRRQRIVRAVLGNWRGAPEGRWRGKTHTAVSVDHLAARGSPGDPGHFDASFRGPFQIRAGGTHLQFVPRQPLVFLADQDMSAESPQAGSTVPSK